MEHIDGQSRLPQLKLNSFPLQKTRFHPWQGHLHQMVLLDYYLLEFLKIDLLQRRMPRRFQDHDLKNANSLPLNDLDPRRPEDYKFPIPETSSTHQLKS